MEELQESIKLVRKCLEEADAVLIGAGAGLSTSSGFVYDGERFRKYFGDFISKYHFRNMYEGGFYPFHTPEEHWAYWSRYIYINRYIAPPKPVYRRLFELVRDKDYFVLTTNVDHCFQKAGFEKERLFYTQGDYGLFQCSTPCHHKTYDNEETVRKMILAQGYNIADDGELIFPAEAERIMRIPAELIPHCPVCGKTMSMNLRADETFVQDEGWDRHAALYNDFLQKNRKKKIVLLELGVGYNTPGIIKYPFWQLTAQNLKATYVCVNFGEGFSPKEISDQSIVISADIGDIINLLAPV